MKPGVIEEFSPEVIIIEEAAELLEVGFILMGYVLGFSVIVCRFGVMRVAYTTWIDFQPKIQEVANYNSHWWATTLYYCSYFFAFDIKEQKIFFACCFNFGK